MARTTISVTQEDIDHGATVDCKNCPVARAVHRVTNNLDLHVFQGSLRECSTSPRGHHVRNWPDHIVAWIKDFDNGKDVQPFSFDLDIPQELWKLWK